MSKSRRNSKDRKNAEIKKEVQAKSPEKPQLEKKSAKSSGEMVRLALILFSITSVVALLLGFVNAVTEAPIKEIQTQIEQKALMEVMEGASFEEIPVPAKEGSIVSKVFKATKDENDAGYAVAVLPSGFGGTITMIVGVDTEGTVTGIKVTRHTETPGLGSKAQDSGFASQFSGKKAPIEVTKSQPSENEIIAISSATITSKAVTQGVNAACEYVAGLE